MECVSCCEPAVFILLFGRRRAPPTGNKEKHSWPTRLLFGLQWFRVITTFVCMNCRKLMEELISTEESYIRDMERVIDVSSED